MDNNQNRAKAMFSNAFKKVTDISKKTAEGAKSFVEQTQKNIHEQQAKNILLLHTKSLTTKNSKFRAL